MSDIIRIERLTKRFGPVIGVDDVTLAVAEGEFVTLLGPSGCGKSTLLRMIGGFEEPTSGRILLAGKDVTALPPNRRDVNMVFQDYALFPHMSVGKNVAYGLRAGGMPKAEATAQAREALDLVGLADRYDAGAHQLSGGQRQRVALARAIVRRPKVLLLDEPLSALDANLREAMQVELKHLHTKVGLTFVMVTHDQTEALTMSDRVVVMREGRVVEDGAPAALYEAPATAYVAGFIGTTNVFAGRSENGVVSCHGQPLRVMAEGEGLFGFRPEKAQLRPETSTGDNLLRGDVAEVLYQGRNARITVRIGDGEVIVDQPLNGSAAIPAPGARVAVHVAADRIMRLRDDREAAE
ncbi:MAG: ABC transporter ATP-binding protein [Rhodobacter sp.]|nr:ABC transporter ATP-binding protein [Rhodobacter sp.]